MLRSLRLLTLLSLGCGTTQASAPSDTTRTPLSAPSASTQPGSELLAPDATYGALVRTASEREGQLRERGACLLVERAAGFDLRAELAGAVRPLPAAPDDLDEALKRVERVELLGAFGRYGDGNGQLALAAFTAATPAREAAALILTDRGISLRGPSGSTLTPRDALDASSAIDALSLAPGAGLVFVAAEAGRPVRDVHALLAQLAQRGIPAVLSVSLSLNTTLPLPVGATARVARCPDGLPATDAPEGSLPKQRLLDGLTPLREHAPDCLLRGDARGAAGGRLSLALRIAPSGQVQDACIVVDQLADSGVGACVIELARGLTFDAPSGGGVIDVELPIVLRAVSSVSQRAACTEGDLP
jgi:hypothetical protein